MPASGALRHRVRIDQRDEGLDGFGTPLDSWSEVFTVWAAIEDRRSREFDESSQATINETTTNVRIRFREGLVPEMRVTETCHQGRVFNITGIRDTRGRARELVLECEEQRVEVPT